MKKLMTILLLGASAGMQAFAVQGLVDIPNKPQMAPSPDAQSAAAPAAAGQPSAAQIEQLNKQIEAMQKQLTATQQQLKAMQGSQGVAGNPGAVPPENAIPQPPTPPTPPTAPAAPAAPAPPAPPAAPRVSRDEVSRIGGSYTVGRDEVVNGDARVVGGSLTIDGVVKGDASTAGGSLNINGQVDGDAAATGGSIYLGPHAVVKGDLSCMGGNLRREPGSEVQGEIHISGGTDEVETNVGVARHHHSHAAMMDGPMNLPLVFTLFVVGVFMLTLWPRRVDTVGKAFVNRPGHSFLIGLASVPVLTLVMLVSVVTIIGPFVVGLGWAAAFLMGVVAVALMLGRRVSVGKSYRSRFYPLAVGLGVWLLAMIVSHVAEPLFILMCVATAVAYTMAIGAALMTGFGLSPFWLRDRISRQPGAIPSVDPSQTYAGSMDHFGDVL